MKWLDKLKNNNFNFARSGRKFAIAPAVILVVAIVMFCILGFNLGLDFTGGAILTVNATDVITEDYIVEKMEADYAAVKYSVTAGESFNGGNTFAIKFNAGDDNSTILTTLSDYFGDENVISSDSISAATSNEKVMTVFWSILAACAGLMVYMLFRFRFTAGVTTLLALAHDVLMICAFMIIFQIEINTSFIAAVLTVIAYSINNSLVVFDRVRDFEKHNTENYTLEQMLNKSINRTLGRCVLTIITTLATLITLTIVSVVMSLTSLIEFALPIIIGLIVGTYSSLFLIAPLYRQFETARLVRQQKKTAQQHANV